MRFEGVAPFGQPGFILVARDDAGTLLLPRDNRVLQGARPEDILGAMTGITLSPADLQAILTGCVTPMSAATGGRLHRNGWASIDVAGGARLFLQRQDVEWEVRAATRPGWQIEYPDWQGDFPRTVRLRSTTEAIDVNLTADVAQVEANVDLPASAFMVNVPESALPITIGELRNGGPLRGQ